MLVTAAVVGFLFYRRQTNAPEPLIPIAILRNRDIRYATIAYTLGWGSIVGINIFMPQYLQNVAGFTPTVAGLRWSCS